MADPQQPFFSYRIDQLRFGIVGIVVVIGMAFIMAWGVLQYGPFELRSDENRDFQELREQRSGDKEAMSAQLKQVNDSVQQVARDVGEIKTTNEKTALDIAGIHSELTYQLPVPPSGRK